MDSTPATQPPRARSFGWIDFWLLTVVVTWAVNFKAAQLAGRLPDGARLDPRTLIWLRMALVVPVLLPLAARLGRRPIGELLRLTRREAWIFAGLSFAAIPLNQFFFIWGMQHTSTVHGALLFATSPALASGLSHLTGIDRSRKRVWWGMVIAFVGVALVVSRSALSHGAARTDAEPGLFGDLLILGSASAWGIYATGTSTALGKRSAMDVTALTMTFGLAWCTVLFGSVAVRDLAAHPLQSLTPSGWGGLLYIAYMGALYGWVVWTRGIAMIGPTRTMLYQYFVPLVSMLLGVAFFGEALEARAVAGAALILTGVAIGRRG
ncbi:MAG: DMT family transporter [Deltaproteobacteria bacterium]|nr:DMT family transporter [Deltaproteobacteria bacterium]